MIQEKRNNFFFSFFSPKELTSASNNFAHDGTVVQDRLCTWLDRIGRDCGGHKPSVGRSFWRGAWVHAEKGLNLPLGSCSRAGTCLHFLQADHGPPVHEYLLSKEDPNPSRTKALHGTFRYLLFLGCFPPFFTHCSGLGIFPHCLSLPPTLPSPWHWHCLLKVAFPWWDSRSCRESRSMLE